MSAIGERIARIQERIAAAARQAGRGPSEITLVGVSKTHPPEAVQAALAAGLAHFGENRVQEAEGKIAALHAARITWHLIGHLQRNKAKRAAALFDVIHTVDSVDLAQTLDRIQGTGSRGQGTGDMGQAADPARAPEPRPLTPVPLSVLIQVNVSGEASKEGFDLAGWEEDARVLDRFRAATEQLLACEHLAVRGLMTIAPWTDDARVAPAVFRSTRRLRDTLAQSYPAADWNQLSMGMSDDFEAAIAEGATLVRVGRAIFGSRE